jgi:uncharacterized low-complexity protein
VLPKRLCAVFFDWSNAMSRNNARNTTIGILGIALAGLTLGGSAFAMQPLSQGHMMAASKTAEGKCGEGKCGDASFARTDTDDDGRVSKAEFLAVAPTRGADFPNLDTSKDGFISEKEAYDFLKATYEANGKPMPAGVFARYGK